MTEPDLIDLDAPTPWVLCPECGGTWLLVAACIERGRWNDAGEYVPALPRVGAYVSSDDGEALQCRDCGHKFDLPDPYDPGNPYRPEPEETE